MTIARAASLLLALLAHADLAFASEVGPELDVRATPHDCTARDPDLAWSADYDGAGFVVRSDAGDWSFGLALERWGFPGNERDVDPVATCVDGARVELSRESA